MKKIAIVTFQRTCNYGAALQCYALKKKLEKKNNEVSVIDYRNEHIEKEYKIFKGSVKDIVFLKNNLKNIRNFKKFNKKLNFSKEYYEVNEFKKNTEKFDIYITGSDQVWNPDITGGLDDVYSLNFRNNAKRVSYAASIGIDEIPNNLKSIYKEKLSNLDLISVREENAKNELENIIQNKKINVVLDPTLLLTKDDWKELAGDRKIKDKYLLVYSLKEDERLIKLANDMAKKTNLRIVHFRKSNKKYKENNPINLSTVGPDDFVNAIMYADIVLTNSFHGTAFSIVLNKDFYCFLPKGTSSRVKNLLKIVKLEDRILENEHNIKFVKINYEIVNKYLNEEREKSEKYIKAILE